MSKKLVRRRAEVLGAFLGVFSLPAAATAYDGTVATGQDGQNHHVPGRLEFIAQLGEEQKVAPSIKVDPKAVENTNAAAGGEQRSVALLTVVLLQDEKETYQALPKEKLDAFVKSVGQTANAFLNSESKFDTKQLIIRVTITPDGNQNFSLTSKPGLAGRITAGLDQALLTVPKAEVKSPVAMEIIYAVGDNETKVAGQMRKLIRAGNAAEAITQLAPMAATDTKNAFVWQTLGWAYASQGDYVNAEKTLKRAVELDSRDFDSWSNLVSTYHSEGKVKEAALAAQKSLDCAPDQEAIDTVNINNALFSGDWPRAETILRKLCQQSGENGAPFQVILACALRWQGKNDEARELLEKALKHEMGDYYTKLAQKQLALINGDWKTAEELSRRDLSKDPKDYESLYDLGVALKGAGKLEDARKAFESALQPVTPQSIKVLIDEQIKNLPRVSNGTPTKTSAN
ncbi:MAG: tetratricopeptide repeat protein [Cyanobacteria bacterium SZAS TMP-1]|nr:tetratricopeptide repeat protein [Cyanobacteria bacterium SZAS TMP-1]